METPVVLSADALSQFNPINGDQIIVCPSTSKLILILKDPAIEPESHSGHEYLQNLQLWNVIIV